MIQPVETTDDGPEDARSMASLSGTRVTFLCPSLDSGGAEYHWRDLIIALDQRGLSVRLIAINGTGRAFEQVSAAGVQADCLGAPRGVAAVSSAPMLVRMIRRQTDAVVSWEINAGLVGSLAGIGAQVPHIINWHRGPGSLITRPQLAAMRIARLLNSSVIAVSEAQLAELSDLGFGADRVTVIPNGTLVPRYGNLSKSEARSRLGVPQDGFLCVLLGRLSPEKRIDRFIESIGIAARTDNRIRGAVIGDGPMRVTLQTVVEEYGGTTTLEGFHPEPSIWIKAADVLCLTSDREAMPVSILEAASCGRPAIGPNIGGIDKIIEDGQSGLLVKQLDASGFASAIRGLARSPEMVESMSERAHRLWSRSFTHEAMVDAYLKAFGESIAGHRSSGSLT